MEPTAADAIPGPPAGTDALPLLFSFRRYPVFSKRFARYVLIITLSVLFGALSSSSPENLHRPRFLITLGIMLTILIAVFIARRIYMEKKGGASPLKLESTCALLPLHMHSKRTMTISYEDVLSVRFAGKNGRVLILDTKRRVFVYPANEFAEPGAAQKILAVLRERITALPEGAAQWKAMESRQTTGANLSAVKPRITWATLLLISLIFAAQCFFTRDTDLFGMLDMGANASILTLNGDWFRLVTANLLHANFMHIFNNALFILVVGAMAERLLGARRFLIVVLLTGILSQLTSAVWHNYASFPSVIFSVGISGVLFGILGALAVLNRRFRSELPGGFRLARRFWWIVLGVNLIVTPLAFPEVDTACHIGGLVSGLFIGWLLCRGQSSLTAPPRPGLFSRLALGALCLMWCVALLTAVQGIFNPDVREANHNALIHVVLTAPASDPGLDNALAWSIAIEPSPTQKQLEDGLALARRSVDAANERKGVKRHDRLASIDTMATVQYRMGDFDSAIDSEMNLIDYPDPNFASQLMRFLGGYHHKLGPRLMDASSAYLPKLALNAPPPESGKWSFNLSLPEAVSGGAQIYALMYQDGTLIGMVRISLPPNAMPVHYTNWTLDAAQSIPLLKADSDAPAPQLVLAQYDKRSCRCKEEDGPRAWFYPYDKDVASLP